MHGIHRSRLAGAIAVALLLSVASIEARHGRGASKQQSLVGRVSGRVIDASTADALGGALVTIESPSLPNNYTTRNVIVGADGLFSFDRVPRGRYLIRVRCAGFFDAVAALETDGTVDPRPFSVDESSPNQAFDVPMTRWSVIHGHVVDEKGEPVVGIPVRVLERVWVGGQARFAAGPIATTDDRGFYRVTKLGRGSFVVTVPSPLPVVPISVAEQASVREIGTAGIASRTDPIDGPGLAES